MSGAVVGTLIGGTVGGIGSFLTASEQAQLQKDAIEKYNGDINAAIAAYMANTGRNIDAYKQNSQQYMNSPDKVAAWLNPAMDFQMKQANLANNTQYAAGGKMLSGSSMKGLQDRRQNIAKLSFNDAFGMMNQSNNQGLGNLQFSTGMANDLESNKFNALQGMYGNQLNAAMGQRTAGVGDFLSGFGSGASAFGNVVNAFRSSPSTGQPSTVKTAKE